MKVGVNPIAWTNGDFPELGSDVPFERCLSEIERAGFEGTELGSRFPTEPRALRTALYARGLELISGWHASRILSRSPSEEERAFREFARFVASAGGCYAVVAELTRGVQRERCTPLCFDAGTDVLTRREWARLAAGVERLAAIADDHGLELVYHPHMGTVVQDASQVRALVERTSARVRLTADTGHIRFAGDDPVAFFEQFADRIGLVHLKDVRGSLVDRYRREPPSFYEAVMAGVFTVPGDGDIDFSQVFSVLRRRGYDGWVVVEAEQDPKKADPFIYSRRGREAVRTGLGV